MKLSIMERIGLLGVMPEKGNFITLKIVDEARRALSFTEKEIKVAKIVTLEGGRIQWDPAYPVADVKLGEKIREMIVTALKKLDESEELTRQLFDIYARFVENKEK